MFWTIVIIAIILFIIIGINGQQDIKKNNEKLTADGFSIATKIDTGKYIAGHPQLDNALNLTAIFPKDDWLYIFEYPDGLSTKMPVHKAGIQLKSIKNIVAEDSSTIEKKVTVGRLLAVGIFAFALKKKQKNELAYLTIEWNDGKFAHETYFEFDSKDAMQKANTARNALIRRID